MLCDAWIVQFWRPAIGQQPELCLDYDLIYIERLCNMELISLLFYLSWGLFG